MKIASVIQLLESIAPLSLQEGYDNAGLITGRPDWECTGVLCALDSTEAVVEEAILRGCNLVIAHHPIIFSGLKKINGKNYVERTVIRAIRQDIAIYAIHTNLDNVLNGVNGRIARQLGLVNTRVLQSRRSVLKKLVTFVPGAHTEKIKQALFDAGGGHIGAYSECSFSTGGTGTFRAGEGSQPFVGEKGKRHEEPENRVEVVFPAWLEARLLDSLRSAHPYEEVAYDIISLDNTHPGVGSGLIGELSQPLDENEFLRYVKERFGLKMLRHTALTGRPISTVACCGGAGSFLISNSLQTGADAYLTADLKYHEFFDADGRLLLCDLGHYESEQFTIDWLVEILQEKFPTFAVLKSDNNTNPVYYYF